jgi:hypothetical protein
LTNPLEVVVEDVSEDERCCTSPATLPDVDSDSNMVESAVPDLIDSNSAPDEEDSPETLDQLR